MSGKHDQPKVFQFTLAPFLLSIWSTPKVAGVLNLPNILWYCCYYFLPVLNITPIFHFNANVYIHCKICIEMKSLLEKKIIQKKPTEVEDGYSCSVQPRLIEIGNKNWNVRLPLPRILCIYIKTKNELIIKYVGVYILNILFTKFTTFSSYIFASLISITLHVATAFL